MNLNTKRHSPRPHPFTSNTEPTPSVSIGIVPRPSSSHLSVSLGRAAHPQPAPASRATPPLPAGHAAPRRAGAEKQRRSLPRPTFAASPSYAAATFLRRAGPYAIATLLRRTPLCTPPPSPPFAQIPVGPELCHRQTHPLVGSTSA